MLYHRPLFHSKYSVIIIDLYMKNLSIYLYYTATNYNQLNLDPKIRENEAIDKLSYSKLLSEYADSSRFSC